MAGRCRRNRAIATTTKATAVAIAALLSVASKTQDIDFPRYWGRAQGN
jgi:hypothetical protein